VYITLVAPDFNHDKTVRVDIATNEGKILNYQLVQTVENTGIFTGEIRLSGLKKYLSKYDQFQRDFFGITSGQGPSDGSIPSGRDDGIQITFQLSQNETVVGSALVRWNIGEVQWLDATYPIESKGKIRVVDPDMNFNPDEIDTIEVKVWSDSDVIKKSVILHETNTNIGIFEGEINFDSQKSDKSTLRVAEGDTIVAEYIDFTLPDPYTLNDDLEITGTSMIGTVIPPLQRIFVSDFKLTNEDGKEISAFSIEKPFFIESKLHNKQDREQPFAFLVKLQDENNVTVLFESKNGILQSNTEQKISIKCLLKFGGTFSINAFVWESEDNPTALSSPLTKRIKVEGKTFEDLGISKPLFEEPKTIEIDIKKDDLPKKENIVIIPMGSSSPGCEETGKCLIPSILEIKLDEEVTWENHDTAAHTITSGTPEMGPDGEFDSSLFMGGNIFSVRFTKKGEYPYFDMTHPWQAGMVIVK